MVVASAEFAGLARDAAVAQGLPEARIAVVAHPVGGVDERGLLARADAAVEEVLGLYSPGG